MVNFLGERAGVPAFGAPPHLTAISRVSCPQIRPIALSSHQSKDGHEVTDLATVLALQMRAGKHLLAGKHCWAATLKAVKVGLLLRS